MNKQIGCFNYHLILLYIKMHQKKDLIRGFVFHRKFSRASTTALTTSFSKDLGPNGGTIFLINSGRAGSGCRWLITVKLQAL